MTTPAVGFDFDMTLADTRAGIAATFRELTAVTGTYVDDQAAIARLGPPLRTELANWFPPAELEEAVTTYRALYEVHAIEPTVLLPGARAAVDAVHELGGRVVVVTSKLGRLAELHLRQLGLAVDAVAGDLFAEGKATAITAHGCGVYVGDHVADMVAARTAGVPGVGVPTGPCSAEELETAGARLVLTDLREFSAALPGLLQLAL
ncbi:HAD hydrolase-like protein [Asanoa sp. WMMD1127]|uniref:HAD family hydrolase n=1 Tax=Asanoa sp. WMMD1127 TaxID=3016107 RepID=UPI00241645CD|nr:HAD hydrolase-like protein [Asanoa sp. WMMD1127]MDG4821524.1 HAD hydrolase-like protein [Asanoa sp. WMMD1127]